MKPLAEFLHRGTFSRASDFTQQVVGEGQAHQRGSRLERTVQVVRYVSELNHLRHAKNLLACFAHVNATG